MIRPFCPRPRSRPLVPSPASGLVQDVDAFGVALAALKLGAGRAKAEDPIDPAVGVAELVKVGQGVSQGQALCVIHANQRSRVAEAQEILQRAIVVGPGAVAAVVRVGEVIG